MKYNSLKVPISSKTSQGGFSLIEVVISISIFSLVVGLLYSSFWTSTRLLTRDDSDIRKLEQRLLIQRLIPKWLENATVTTETNRSKHLYFSGTQRAVTFFSMQKHYTGTPVLYKLQLSIEKPNNQTFAKSQLKITQRIEKPFFSGIGSRANIQQSVIEFDSEVRGFSYRASGYNSKDEALWQKNWEFENSLPDTVRLDLGNGDQIIASPKTKLDAECLSRRGLEGLAGRFCGTME